MTNAEKFKQIFGFEVATNICPFNDAKSYSYCRDKCKYFVPLESMEITDCLYKFWNDEYKEDLND